MNPFTTAGRTVLSSQVTSATAINAGAVLPWTCGCGFLERMRSLHPGVGHRIDRDTSQ